MVGVVKENRKKEVLPKVFITTTSIYCLVHISNFDIWTVDTDGSQDKQFGRGKS